MVYQHDQLLGSSRKFGEIFCNPVGVLSVHCVLCPSQMNYDEFIVHYTIHISDSFDLKQEATECVDEVSEPIARVDVAEISPAADEIKLESITQATDYTSDYELSAGEIKSEPNDFAADDNCSSSDHTLTENAPPVRRKRGRPKNSTKFDEAKACPICGKTFKLRTEYKEHIRLHQCGPTPTFYECDVCGRKASKLTNLIDHFRYKHMAKTKCTICGKMVRKRYLSDHKKRHTNERNHKCMHCHRAFVLPGDLTTHLKYHSSTPPAKPASTKKFSEPRTCDVCDQKFIGIISYERHIQSHGTTSSLYECDICGHSVKEKKNLISHMLYRHSNQPKLKAPCTICGKSFSRKYLSLHLRKHNMADEKPSHICPTCGKTFLVSGDLSTHLRQHNQESVPCDICGKTFASAASLGDHKRVHTGERPFPCPICGLTFRTRSTLHVHRTIHLTEKNFACNICHMKFKNPTYVNTHKRKVHEKDRIRKKKLENDVDRIG